MSNSIRTRHRLMLELLELRGACTYQELSTQFDVSTMTIRRDVDLLAGQGRVIKTLGGVQNAHAPAYFFETPLYSRISKNLEAKQTIAATAFGLIKSGQTLFIDGSTTCLHLARLIAERCNGLTVVTNSALTSIELGKSGNNMVVCLGGQFEKDTISFVGPTAEDAAGKFFVDLALVSTKGFIPAEGTFESSVGNVRVKQVFAEQSAKTILLADHTKIGERALTKAIDIARISALVTDRPLSSHDAAALKRMSKQVLIGNRKRRARKEAANAS